jgi:predicted transcriptional regulator
MSRTSIPVDSETKERLDELKRDDETWDQFLERTTLSAEPIQKGFLSERGAEEAKKNIKKSRESF